MLARHLRAREIEVLEVERAKHRRQSSRQNVQKSDPSDAEAAARTVFWPEKGEASGVPKKSADGRVEMIRGPCVRPAAPLLRLGPKGRQPATKLAREGT
jgi:hypothetical protein